MPILEMLIGRRFLMFRRISFVLALVVILVTQIASAEVKTLSLSPVFTGTSATPRVVRNETDSLWVVAWRQGSPGKILARTTGADGKLGPVKTLATGLTSASYNFDFVYDSLANRYLIAFESAQGLRF